MTIKQQILNISDRPLNEIAETLGAQRYYVMSILREQGICYGKSKKELIIEMHGKFKPSVIARKIKCRREWVYKVMKICDLK